MAFLPLCFACLPGMMSQWFVVLSVADVVSSVLTEVVTERVEA